MERRGTSLRTPLSALGWSAQLAAIGIEKDLAQTEEVLTDETCRSVATQADVGAFCANRLTCCQWSR